MRRWLPRFERVRSTLRTDEHEGEGRSYILAWLGFVVELSLYRIVRSFEAAE